MEIIKIARGIYKKMVEKILIEGIGDIQKDLRGGMQIALEAVLKGLREVDMKIALNVILKEIVNQITVTVLKAFQKNLSRGGIEISLGEVLRILEGADMKMTLNVTLKEIVNLVTTIVLRAFQKNPSKGGIEISLEEVLKSLKEVGMKIAMNDILEEIVKVVLTAAQRGIPKDQGGAIGRAEEVIILRNLLEVSSMIDSEGSHKAPIEEDWMIVIKKI